MLFISDKKHDSFHYLKKVFKIYYNYHLDKNNIIYNEYQKPYLKDNVHYYNISHTDDKIVICIDEHEVGVDIEKLRKYNKGIAEKIFTESEQAYCQNNDVLFTKIFIKKESYAKFLGRGLGEYLSNIDILNDPLIKIINYQEYYIAVTNSGDLEINEIE